MFGHIDRTVEVYCPIRDVMALTTDKWSILIVLYLGFFPVLRFNKLKKYISDISNKVLSGRLKILEADGYISRQMFPEVPVRVECSLADFGHSYLQRLLELAEWAEKHKEMVIGNRKKYRKA